MRRSPLKPRIDLTGKRFGLWTVIGVSTEAHKRGDDWKWSCVCECGQTRSVRARNLIGGYSLSCGRHQSANDGQFKRLPETVKERVAECAIFTAEGCWEWIRVSVFGYGITSAFDDKGKSRPERAHRWVWKMVHGPIPEGMVVMHICDHRACVNPDHLKLGTVEENNRDCVLKGRNRWSSAPEKAARYERALKLIAGTAYELSTESFREWVCIACRDVLAGKEVSAPPKQTRTSAVL